MVDSNINSTKRDIVGVQLEQIIKAHETMNSRLAGIDERLLNPETGLFSKVRDIDNCVDEISESVSETKSDIDKLIDICHRHEARLANSERWTESHEVRDAELRDSVIKITNSLQPILSDYDIRLGRKKWTDKIIWLLIAGILTGMLPTLKYMFIDAENEQKKIQKLEQIILEERAAREEDKKIQK